MKRIIPIFLILLLLSGCRLDGRMLLPELSENVGIPAEPAPSPAPSPVSDGFRWGRSQLPPAEQEAYDILSAAVALRETGEVAVPVNGDGMERVVYAVCMDHPEYFWFDGHIQCTTYTSVLTGEAYYVTPYYTMTEQEIQAMEPLVAEYTAQALEAVAGAQSDYERVLGIYQYIIYNTDYNLGETDQSFCTVMSAGQGVCAGYGRCFQYLMDQLEIPCILVSGESEGQRHCWNMVQCQEQWYHVDVTWGDPLNEYGAPGDSVKYTYCMVTDKEIYQDHSADPDIPLPSATAVELNYYRQAGRWMEFWDRGAYDYMVLDAANRGDREVTVRFARGEDYNAALYDLVEQQAIHTILENCGIYPPDGIVTYSVDDLFYEFTIQIMY